MLEADIVGSDHLQCNLQLILYGDQGFYPLSLSWLALVFHGDHTQGSVAESEISPLWWISAITYNSAVGLLTHSSARGTVPLYGLKYAE